MVNYSSRMQKKGSAAIIAALVMWQQCHWPFALCAFLRIFLP